MAAPGSAPAAPAAPAYTPIVTDVVRLLKAPFAPGAVLGEQADRPTFWMPWLLVSVALSAITVLMMPFQLRIMHLASEAHGRQLPAAAEKFAYVGVVAVPIVLLALSAVAAGVLWLVMLATGSEVRFKGLLCATIFAAPVSVLKQALVAVVLKMRGLESLQSAMDIRVSLGLDLLLPTDTQTSTFVRTLLGGIGPLEIWSLVVLAVGLAAVERIGKGKACTAVIVQYVVVLVIAAGIAAMFAGRAG